MKNKVCALFTALLLFSVSLCVAQSGRDVTNGGYTLPSLSTQAAAAGKQMLPYSIQVERVDTKVDGVPAAFSAAIYENLISELTKSGRYQQVLRDGDKRADSTGNLVKLKTTVQKFEEGSETKRAVTTVSGATKVLVHMQAVGSDGKVLMEKDVEGAVHFIGTNLRATLNLSNSMVKQLNAGLGAPTTAKK